jgi:hypothetical protein
MTMVRKQIYITQEQDRAIKKKASEAGTTEAELVRLGIDLITREPPLTREEAWRELLAFMKERAKIKVPYQPRTWTRDELYDDD